MVLTPKIRARRRSFHLLLLAFFALLIIGGAGCTAGTPFGPQIPVADKLEQAMSDGKDKDAAAQKAQDANRLDDAAKLWGDAAAYYHAVSGKFTGGETAITALLLQAKDLEKQVDASTVPGKARNYAPAQVALRNALKQYPAASFVPGSAGADARKQAQAEYESLIGRMDTENSKSYYYKIMDFLVRALGGDTEVAPILAIVVISVVVNIATWPLVRKQIKSAKEFARYQPEIKKLQATLQAKYKDKPQEIYAKQQEFMKTHGINQFAGCLPALAQWPVTLLMYYMIVYYQFHFHNTHFLWVNPVMGDASYAWPAPLTGIIGHNLSEQDMPLLILYAGAMYVQAKLTPVSPSADPAQIEQQKMMATFMPVILFITMLQWQPPSAFVLYWILSICFGAGRYYLINRSLPDLPPHVLSGDGSSVDGGEPAKAGVMTANPKLVSPKNRQAKRK